MSSLVFIFNNNSSILEEYKKQFQRFFARPNIQVVVYCSSENLVSEAKEIMGHKSEVQFEPSCVNFCTSFLHFLSKYTSEDIIHNFVYKIETKPGNIKFGDAGQLLQNWRLLEDKMFNLHPCLCGVEQNKTENNKLFQRNHVIDTIQRNNLDANNLIYSFVDKYAFDISNEVLKKKFRLDPDFYTFYESDLRKANISRIDAQNHWDTYGCKELHRVCHPFMVESYGKTNFYIAGANFCVNKAYLKQLQKIKNWREEIRLATENDDICSSWEFLFGLVTYLNFGKVYGVENGVFYENHDLNDQFDPYIYRSVNPDLSGMAMVDELKNHFRENGWAEDRIFSVRLLQKPQNIFNNKIFDAKLAFFLKYPIQNATMKSLKFLLQNNFKVDIYVDVWDRTSKYKGFVLSPIDIQAVQSDVSSVFEMFSQNCNICLGFNTFQQYKCGFVQEGIQGIEYVNKILNLKVLKFLNDQTLIDFVQEQLDT